MGRQAEGNWRFSGGGRLATAKIQLSDSPSSPDPPRLSRQLVGGPSSQILDDLPIVLHTRLVRPGAAVRGGARLSFGRTMWGTAGGRSGAHGRRSPTRLCAARRQAFPCRLPRSVQLSRRPLRPQGSVRVALWRARGGESGGCSRFVQQRKANGEHRSCVLRRLHRDRATMADHDLADDEQPQAQTGL